MKTASFILTAFFSLAIYGQGLQDSLVAYFPLDGNANDASGYGNHGSVVGATAVSGVGGGSQMAYEFDGFNDYIVIPHQSRLNFASNFEFTVALWVKAPQKQSFVFPGQDRNTILSKWENNGPNNSGYPYNIRIANENVTADEGKISVMRFSRNCNYNPLINSSQRVNDTLWHHVIMMRENGYMKVYIDCELETSLAESDTCGMTNSHDLYLGKQGGILNAAYFKGVMDEVRIYNRALTSVEIASLCEISSGQWPLTGPNDIQTFPNPASDVLNFEFDPSLNENLELCIFDELGRQVSVAVGKAENGFQVNTDHVSPGIYHYKVQGIGSTYYRSGRFVVDR